MMANPLRGHQVLCVHTILLCPCSLAAGRSAVIMLGRRGERTWRQPLLCLCMAPAVSTVWLSCFFWGHHHFFSEAFEKEPCRAVENPIGYPNGYPISYPTCYPTGYPVGHSIRYPIKNPTNYVTDYPIGCSIGCFISHSLLSCFFSVLLLLGYFFATMSQGC